MKQIAVIGDIHGSSGKLAQLVKALEEQYPGISLFHVGDLIDRGADSKGVIQLCLDHNIQGVRGNHDDWLFKLVTENKFDKFALSAVMCGKSTFDSYGAYHLTPDELLAAMPDDHKQYVAGLPLWRKVVVGEKTYRLSHTGFNPKVVGDTDTWCDSQFLPFPTSMLWGASPARSKHPMITDFGANELQLFGHLPLDRVRVESSWVALDTGCETCAPYDLSAIVLPENQILLAGHQK